MAFKVLYHEDALADLEEIFDWSRQQHPDTTEQFSEYSSTTWILCRSFLISALRLKGTLTSDGCSILRCMSTTVWMRTEAALRFFTSGMSHAGRQCSQSACEFAGFYLLALCTGCGARRILNCSLFTTAWTMAETL